MNQITIFAILSLLVGCATPPQVQTLQTEENNIGLEQPKEDKTLTIGASGSVYVVVKAKKSNEQLYRNTLQNGESATLELEEAVDVLFTAGEYLVFEWKGERLRPSNKGTGKITLD